MPDEALTSRGGVTGAAGHDQHLMLLTNLTVGTSPLARWVLWHYRRRRAREKAIEFLYYRLLTPIKRLAHLAALGTTPDLRVKPPTDRSLSKEQFMAQYGALVIGPGWVAGEHIRGLCLDPRTEIRAVAGMIPDDKPRAQQYMRQYGFQADYLDDFTGALTRDDIDLVHVCTINHLHYEQALAALQAHKHVLVEKPLCLTLDQLRRLTDAQSKTNALSHVGHVCRYYPAVVGLKNFLDAGHIGDVFYAESDYWHEIVGAWKVTPDTGGSALLMGGCHSVDMVRWMVGEQHEVVEVAAFSRSAAWRSDFQYDPTIALIARFDNGAIGRVSTSLECNMPYVFHLQVNGTKGCLRNNGLYSAELFPKSSNFTPVPATYPDDWNVSHHPFAEEVSYFVDCIESGTPSMLSIAAAAKTYELIFAAELAAREHSVVKLPLA